MSTVETPKRVRKPKARPWREVIAAMRENAASLVIALANQASVDLAMALVNRGRELEAELDRSLGKDDRPEVEEQA